MGGEPFRVYSAFTEVRKAFDEAVEEETYLHGADGESASIAEKSSYVVVADEPMSMADAESLADRMIDNRDPRIDDKWGPAGAIPIRGGRRTWRDVEIPPLASGYADRAAAVAAAMENKLVDGETITSEVTGVFHQEEPHHLGYGRRMARRITGGTIDVVTENADTVTGWLFFGWANS